MPSKRTNVGQHLLYVTDIHSRTHTTTHLSIYLDAEAKHGDSGSPGGDFPARPFPSCLVTVDVFTLPRLAVPVESMGHGLMNEHR